MNAVGSGIYNLGEGGAQVPEAGLGVLYSGSEIEGIGFMALDTKGNLGAWTGMWLPGAVGTVMRVQLWQL